MNDQVEVRLREALAEASDTVRPATLRALVAPRRPRIRINTRLLVVAMAILPLAVGAATLLRSADRNYQMLFTGTAGTSPGFALEPGGPEISVYLCKADSPFPSCSDSQGVTPEQVDAIEQALRAMPQVESITFEDQQTAYERFVEQYGNSTLAQVVKPDDMPESFHLKMKEDTDWTPTLEAAVALPGVSNVIDEKCYWDRYSAGDSDFSECGIS